MKDKTPDIFKSHHINENITLYSEVYFNINSIQDVKNIWKTYYKNQKFYKLPEVIIKVDASILTSRFTTNIKNYIPNFNFKLFSCFNTSNEKKFLYIGITDKSICTSSNLEIIFEGITNYFEQFTDLRNKISKEYPPVYKKLPNKKNSLIEEKSNKEYSPYFERTRRERSPYIERSRREHSPYIDRSRREYSPYFDRSRRERSPYGNTLQRKDTRLEDKISELIKFFKNY